MYFIPDFNEPWYQLHTRLLEIYEQAALLYSASLGLENKDAIIKMACLEISRNIQEMSDDEAVNLLKKVLTRMPDEAKNPLIWKFFDENLNLGASDMDRFRTESLAVLFNSLTPEWIIAEAIEIEYGADERIRYISLVILKKLEDVWEKTIPHVFQNNSQ